MHHNRYQSAEAQAILKIGHSNPIVHQVLTMWEHDQCTWEQALVGMVTALNAAYINQHQRLVQALDAYTTTSKGRVHMSCVEPFLERERGYKVQQTTSPKSEWIDLGKTPPMLQGQVSLTESGFCVECGGTERDENGKLKHRIGCKA